MKIAFIKSRFLIHGGAERYLERLIDRLLSLGNEIHLFAESWKPDERLKVNQVKTFNFGSFLRAYSFNKNLKINLKEYDCVISFERTTKQHIYRAGEGTHRRWLEIRSQFEPFYKKLSFKVNPLHQYYLKLEREIFLKTPLIIANSKMVRDEVVNYYGISPDKVVVIYNGVDIDKFKGGDKIKLRQKYGFPKEVFIILFVGSGFERKGLGVLLQALSKLKERDFLLIILGKGNQKKYSELAQKLRIEEKVSFLGTRMDISDFYALSDLFVLPTIYDPFSNATLEAMASGLPVITTKNNGASELIDDGVDGFTLIHLANSEELAEKISSIMIKSSRMGEQSRKKATYYTIDKAVKDFTECIKKFS